MLQDDTSYGITFKFKLQWSFKLSSTVTEPLLLNSKILKTWRGSAMTGGNL